MRIGVVTARGSAGEAGGAERFYEALVSAFAGLGHEVEEVPLVIDEPDFERIQRNYLACYDLDLRRFDMVVSTKAPTWMIRHPRHVCYLVHTIRVFYDMFEQAFPSPWQGLVAQRDWIHRVDTLAFAKPRCRGVFTIGKEVSDRLLAANGVEAPVLHPPLWSSDFRTGEQGDYFFLPGRLHPWKRVDLAIRAFLKTRLAKRLVIAGVGEAENDLRALAGNDQRIEFVGRVSDAELVAYYANCLAVPFVPLREDYGYITLEAFASGKPVITCRDSGEAANIVRDGVSGFVVDSDEDIALAGAMDALQADRERAVAMGREGKRWVESLSWGDVARTLIAAAGGGK